MTDPRDYPFEMYLTVDFKGTEVLGEYWYKRIRDGGVEYFQSMQDRLFCTLQGGSDPTSYETLQASAAFRPVLEGQRNTDLPSNENIFTAAKAAVTAYNDDENFSMQLEVLSKQGKPDCVKYIRKDGKIFVEYNYDLKLTEDSVTPDEVSELRTEGIESIFRLVMWVRREPDCTD